MIKIKHVNKKRNYNVALVVTFIMGVICIVSTYAWFYASLDVKVKFINLKVENDSGLTISLDGVNFGSSIQISKDDLIENLKTVYPNNTSQWPVYGLRPVSTNGIKTSNDEKFDIYYSSSAEYRDDKKIDTYLTTKKTSERTINGISSFVAFDIFLRNKTGSPVSDNLYLDEGTSVLLDGDSTEEMQDLLNSIRIGFLRIGSVSLESTVNEIQNVKCNNSCQSIIYEPHSTEHTNLSIEKAKKYNINLMNGTYYPTYAMINAVNGINIMDIADGSDTKNFSLQITRLDFNQSLFEIPDGITKVRIYIWLEGQDIDSLETKSTGANLSINLNFIKDTAGYDYFND